MLSAHRFIYRMTYGEFMPSLSVLHRCDVKTCVNPHHLWLGTQRDNVYDAIAKGIFHYFPPSVHPGGMARGEKNVNAKLTSTQILAIRHASQLGQSQRSIAREFGVSQGTIYDIIHRDTWRHVPGE